MDYDRGLTLLVKLARGATWQQDAALLEARLRENLACRRRFGETPPRQSDRAKIIDELNTLLLRHVDMSFTDLCLSNIPQQTSPIAVPTELPSSLAPDSERLSKNCFTPS